jgi:hypothetical protein
MTGQGRERAQAGRGAGTTDELDHGPVPSAPLEIQRGMDNRIHTLVHEVRPARAGRLEVRLQRAISHGGTPTQGRCPFIGRIVTRGQPGQRVTRQIRCPIGQSLRPMLRL